MFPFLDFGAITFVLLAGFALGVLLGWGLRDIDFKRFFDGDGGELLPLRRRRKDAIGRVPGDEIGNVIQFPRRKAS
jgi:hypothetical protein